MFCMTVLLSVRVKRGATVNNAPDGGLESDVLGCYVFDVRLAVPFVDGCTYEESFFDSPYAFRVFRRIWNTDVNKFDSVIISCDDHRENRYREGLVPSQKTFVRASYAFCGVFVRSIGCINRIVFDGDAGINYDLRHSFILRN